ncbi:hypothetical protein NVP1121O_014 [Vibrio phage 1.121.O._10N.286.46.C4]|nr:hypothetical protein NVP1121O_014 [Vibrio phage 1.121.O._10N.286.46.C4]
MKMNLENAVQLRKDLKNSENSYWEKQIINNIFAGCYDQYEDPLKVAKEDLEFLKEINDV